MTCFVEAETLAGELAGTAPGLIDTREELEYEAGHLPGAIRVYDFFRWLCTPETGGLEGMAAHFAELLGSQGIGPEADLVVYEDAMDNGYGRSSRGYFILKLLGHRRVRVLHGGFQAWVSKGLPVERGASPARHETVYPFTPDFSLFARKEDVLNAGRNGAALILDVRDYAEWRGANSSPYGFDYCPRKGRIPGAVWIEWYRFLILQDGLTWIRPAEQVRELCQAVNIGPDTPVICYCFKGARTSCALLAMREAGFTRCLNYFAGWNEWSRDLSLPVDAAYPLDRLGSPFA